jgi:hypothetical protein
MNVEWIGCAPQGFRIGRPVGFRPQLIVIHVIVGSLLSADRWFNNPTASVSAHYGVGHDGQLHQYVSETDTAFHAGIVVNPLCELVLCQPNVNPNYYSIGIEHEGLPNDNWTEEQAAASAALIAAIAQRWNIPIDEKHVIPHHYIRASKTCPGDQRKVEVLIAAALAQNSSGSSAPTAPLAEVPVAPGQAAPVPSAQGAHQLGPLTQPTSRLLPSASQIQAAAVQLEIGIVMNVRVRGGAPSTTAPVVNVLLARTVLRATGAVFGENIQGNPAWYRDVNGNFIWAGGTNAPHPKLLG